VDEQNAKAPDVTCEICEGTGKRLALPLVGPGTNKCNGCEGTGKRRPSSTHYGVDVDHLNEWIDFVGSSGGFEIW